MKPVSEHTFQFIKLHYFDFIDFNFSPNEMAKKAPKKHLPRPSLLHGIVFVLSSFKVLYFSYLSIDISCCHGAYSK
jgi:hypothetical protein